MASQFDIILSGRGLEDYGLYGPSVDGLGLVTYGFLWSCQSIWDTAEINPLNTTWTGCDPALPPNAETCVHGE